MIIINRKFYFGEKIDDAMKRAHAYIKAGRRNYDT